MIVDKGTVMELTTQAPLPRLLFTSLHMLSIEFGSSSLSLMIIDYGTLMRLTIQASNSRHYYARFFMNVLFLSKAI